MNWLKPEEAPKDGNLIIAYFDLFPFVTVAAWDESIDQWALAELQVEFYDGQVAPYFQTETFEHKHLKKWIKAELPE